MKTILLSILVCISYCAAEAQDWCHTGSKWSYYWVSLGGPGQDEYTYTKDTILAGRPCHQLSFVRYTDAYLGNNHYLLDTTPQLPLYTYANNDTTFFYYGIFSEWLPVYYMNSQVGDTLIIPNYAFYTNSDTNVLVLVDSTGTILIDTNHLRYYVFHLIDSCPNGMLNLQGRTTVIERIGVISNDIIPFWHCATDDTYYSLCSYQDDSFALYPPEGCANLPTGINVVKPISFQYQPNPAQDEVKVSIDASLTGANLSIADLNGRNILNRTLNSTDNKVSLSELTNGIYVLTVSQKEKRAVSKKIVLIH